MSDKFLQKPLDEQTSYEQILENRKNLGVIQKEIENIERGDADFVDGTPTNNVDISTPKKEGAITFRVKDTNGGIHTFEMTDKGELFAENVIGAPETNTQKITFDISKDLVYEDQDGGKLKLNNIPIFDAYGTSIGAMKFNSKEIAVEPGDLPTLAQVKSLITGGGVSISFADGVEVEKVKWGDKADLTYVDAKLNEKADKVGNVDNTNIEQEGELFFAKKLNYDGNGLSKLNFYATNENGVEEIRVQFDQTPIMNIKQDGIEMLNGQIDKVVDSISETHLVNRREAKKIASDLIVNAGLGQWAHTYDKYVVNLKPKDTADGLNSGYDWTGDSSSLDRYSQIGHQAGWISIPDGTLDLWYKDTKKPFYEITLIGNFQPIYGEVLWEKDSILITPNDIGEEDRFTTFRVRVEAKDSKGLLFDKEVYEIRVPYYVNINTYGKLELELGLIATYIKQTKTSKDDDKPTTSYGSFDLTSDIDVRVLELQQLDTASIDLSNYYTKSEVNTILDNKTSWIPLARKLVMTDAIKDTVIGQTSENIFNFEEILVIIDDGGEFQVSQTILPKFADSDRVGRAFVNPFSNDNDVRRLETIFFKANNDIKSGRYDDFGRDMNISVYAKNRTSSTREVSKPKQEWEDKLEKIMR